MDWMPAWMKGLGGNPSGPARGSIDGELPTAQPMGEAPPKFDMLRALQISNALGLNPSKMFDPPPPAPMMRPGMQGPSGRQQRALNYPQLLERMHGGPGR